MAQSWVQTLTNIDENDLDKAWAEFFLNEEAVVSLLRDSSPTEVHQVLVTGEAWTGTSWDTTKCAMKVRSLKGVAMVEPDVKNYLHAFLYSLALAGSVSIATLDLSEQAAEVAFRLSERWQARYGPGARADGSAAAPYAPEEDEESGLPKLAWEQQTTPLTDDLELLLKKVVTGERMDVKSFLNPLPVFDKLKSRAEENNHKADAKNYQDKVLRGFQQRLLNMIRAQAALHTVLLQAADEVVAVAQQQFLYMLETEHAILEERKRGSIPGAVQEQGNLLFTADDLRAEKQVLKINNAGMSYRLGRKSYFQTDTGSKQWKFKGFQRGGFQKGWSRPAFQTSCNPNWSGRGFGGRKGKGKSIAASACTSLRAYCRPV
jgi:hypothetical protein